MQIDFHHATTYVLARIAGFLHAEASVIAHSAQYVDDSTCPGVITFKNQAREPYERIASAHPYSLEDAERLEDILENANNTSNIETWSIFHFLPGNGGLGPSPEMVTPGIESFVCTKNSQVAAAMCKACLGTVGQPNSLHRLGITAHVFVDTWAHRDFVGLMHPRNHVKEIREEGATLWQEMEEIGSHIAGDLPLGGIALGHLMALTLPDMPYLHWSYKNGDGIRNVRNNTEDFLEASGRLVALFGYYLNKGEITLGDHDRAELLAAFQTIRLKDGMKRHDAWLKLLELGVFSFGALTPSELEDLAYAAKGPGSWKQKALGTTSKGDEDAPFEWTPDFETSDYKFFHDALKDHRREVLGTIFRNFGLSIANVN